MLYVTGSVGKLKIRIVSVVDGDMDDAKHAAHILAANMVDDVEICQGEIVDGSPKGKAIYKIESDGYGHPVRAAA